MPAITFSGLASGIDADAIIKTLLDSRRLASEPFKKNVEFNDKESSALEELNTKLLSLSDSLKEFLTLSGNAVSKSASTSDEDSVTASVNGAALSSTTTITVAQIAQGARFSFNDRFSSLIEPLAPGLTADSSLTITAGEGDAAESFEIAVTSETSLTEIVDRINEQGVGKVYASAINLGTDTNPQYALVLNTVETGTAEGSLAVTASADLVSQGVFASTTLDQAKNAVFTISGIGEVTRSSNKIEGLIPGVVLDLKRAGMGPILVSVNNDAEKTADKFGKFVEALNGLIAYAKENDKVERVEEDGAVSNVYGSLAKTQVDDQVLVSLRSALSDSTSGVEGSEVNILADLGLTTERDGKLKFDKEKFLTGVNADPIAAAKLLNKVADKLASTNGTIEMYTRFQGAIDSAIEANRQESDTINDRLNRVEEFLKRQEEQLRLTFSRLEQKVSELNSASSAITSMLSSFSVNRR